MLIAQLSDPHVRPAGLLYQDRIDANARFAAAVQHLLALDRAPDLVVLSGDLTDAGEPEAYAELRRMLQALPMPWIVMPGNHDDPQALRAAFADRPWMPPAGRLRFALDDHPVRIVALDSTRTGRHDGHFDADDARWLHATLAGAPRQPTLVLLHHPPFVSGGVAMDAYRCHDGPALEAIVRRHPQVEAVLCGHVHRVMFRRWGGTIVAACPSTASEIELPLDPRGRPGSWTGRAACLLHLWDPAHGLVSHVSAIEGGQGPYPFF